MRNMVYASHLHKQYIVRYVTTLNLNLIHKAIYFKTLFSSTGETSLCLEATSLDSFS